MVDLSPGERLKDRIVELGYSQAAFGKEIDAAQATVSRWVSNQQAPHPRYLPTMARVLELPVEEVASWWNVTNVAGVQRMVERRQRGSGVSPRLRLKETRLVPILGPVPADYPDWMSGLMEEGIYSNTASLAEVSDPKFVVVTDNVLVERGVAEGSMVLLDMDRTPERGNIVLARVEDRVLLREYFPDEEGGYVLRAWVNRDQPIFVSPDDDVEILGVAVLVHREEPLL